MLSSLDHFLAQLAGMSISSNMIDDPYTTEMTICCSKKAEGFCLKDLLKGQPSVAVLNFSQVPVKFELSGLIKIKLPRSW